MSKLQENKDNFYKYDENFGIDTEQAEWLLKEAETHQETREELMAISQENTRYREALRDIANNDDLYMTTSDVVRKARQALEGDFHD